MSTIKGIGLQNFRIFKEMTKFEFAPITVLTGANNSGKSSVIKALLLLAENAKKNKFLELDFSSEQNDLHKLGSFEDVLNKNSESDEISFEIDFENDIESYTNVEKKGLTYIEPTKNIFNFFPSNLFKLKLKYLKNENKVKIKELFIQNNENNITLLNISLNEFENGQKKTFLNIALSSIVNFRKILFDVFKLKDNGELDYEVFVNDINDKGESYGYYEKMTDFEIKDYLKFKDLPKYIFKKDIIEDKLKNFDKNGVKLLIETIHKDLLFKIGSFSLSDYQDFNREIYFNHILYLENNKISERYLENSDFNKDYIFALGDLTIKDIINQEYLDFYKEVVVPSVISIYNEALKSLEFEYLEVLKANTQRIYLNQWQGTPFNGLISRYLKLNSSENKKDFLLKWLGKEGFDLCDDINFHALGYGTVIKVIKNEKEMDLADLGYGATQILALLLKIITSSYGANIILEEPEINLHPKLQSKLADLLVDAHKEFSQNFIVETHSEYFVRKLQYLTAKKEITPKEISLYYFYEPDKIPEGEKQVKKIEFEETGFLSTDFGTGFYDEADKIAIDLHILKNTHKN